MRVVVLGGTGFVGSHVAEALAVGGDDVLALARRPPRYPVNGVAYEQVDATVAIPPGLVAGADAAVFALTTTTPAGAGRDPEYDASSNVVAALELFEALVAMGVPRLVVVSSGGTVYGVPERLPVPETAPTRPISTYGATRLAIEAHAETYAATHGLQTTVLRVGNAYGERQDPDKGQGATAAFLGRLLRDEPIELWGDGSVVRDYVYVGDVGRACAAALAAPPPSPVLNVGSGEGRSLLEILDLCAAIVEREPHVVRRSPRDFDVPAIVLDVSRARGELGWRPETPLEDGLRREAEWLAAEGARRG